MQDGTYSMDLLIGDSAIDVPIQWALGTVAISHQGGDDNSQSSLTAISALFQSKPEIVHIQRTPGRRPLSAVSLLFTGLALAPLGLLAVMLSSVGANLKVSVAGGLQHSISAIQCLVSNLPAHVTHACHLCRWAHCCLRPLWLKVYFVC